MIFFNYIKKSGNPRNLVNGTNPLSSRCLGGFATLILTIIGILSAGLIQSCTDDPSIRVDGSDDNFTGISLLLPDVESAAEYGATRADEYQNTRAYDQSRETNFNTLYIVATADGGEIKIFHKSQPDGLEDGYRKYNISLNPGSYKFYIVSNLNRYLFQQDGDHSTFPQSVSTEDDIRNLIINFTTSIPLEPGFLPMACMHEDIRVDKADANPLGPYGRVVIEQDKSKKIYADMHYLCAKVRYTILFDRSQAPDFGPNDLIDFYRNTSTVAVPYVSNLRHSTAIADGVIEEPEKDYITENSGTVSNWPLFLDRYVYPVMENGKNLYTLNPEEDAELLRTTFNNLTPFSGTWADNKDKRAWQGVTYLPENLLESNEENEDLYTFLNFPYSFNNSQGANSPRKITLNWEHQKSDNASDGKEYGIKRAKSYDVYAIVKSPDEADMIVNVDIKDWTLKEMSYELHGPYELVVETSQIEKLSMQEDVIFWFRSDIPPSEIGFESPKVSISKDQTNAESMRDLFKGQVVKDDQGNYVTDDNGNYLFQVGMNSAEIPYSILSGLNTEGIKVTDPNTNKEITYTKKDVSFFHIVAGSLHKRIDIKELDLNPYLKVNPEIIIIDTRELYTSAHDTIHHYIRFETNVDVSNLEDTQVSLTLNDSQRLISEGKGNENTVLLLTNPKNYKESSSNLYKITDKEGYFVLDASDIITGNSYWNQNNEYKLTFTLTAPGLESPLVKTVTIKIRPFSGTYTIHFRDNTKSWAQPHIYIFQDLTLPTNMEVKTAEGTQPYEYAGKIVGYIEQNPQSGLQWNAAVQYVFTNNLSFKGWHGNHIAEKNANGTYTSLAGNEYGGPEKNDPWETAHLNPQAPNGTETDLTLSSPTYGFVMFGDPYQAKGESERANDDFWFWNYKYSYTHTYQLVANRERYDRYNFDVNFNSDHEVGMDNWSCWECRNLYGNYNNNGERFYTGIAMEREEGENEGWWKYTLSGVAQPGRTVIIFANWHEPWAEKNLYFDYRAEDYRWPGDYEAGLPLFDFEDNDGWFQFDGNTTNNDQRFTDNKPSGFIPNYFTDDYKNFRIEVLNPNKEPISIKEIGYQHEILIAEDDGYANNEYKYLSGAITNSSPNGDLTSFEINNLTIPKKYEYLVIKLNTNSGEKVYKIPPKYLKKDGTRYVNVHPLYLKFDDGIKIMVKWSDAIVPNTSYWGGQKMGALLNYYADPPKHGGSNYLNVYWGPKKTWDNSSNLLKSYYWNDRTIGNYKYIDVETEGTSSHNNTDMLQLRLCTSENDNGASNYYKVLAPEDLPQYYYPAGDKYIVNWHLLPNP